MSCRNHRARIGLRLAVLAASMGLSAHVVSGATPASFELVTTVDAKGRIEGCGVRVIAADQATATITLHRQDGSAAGPLEVSAELPGVVAPVHAITLSTPMAGVVDGFDIDQSTATVIHGRAGIAPDTGALLMRDVLMQGVTLSVIPAAGAAATAWRFDGPAALDVTRSYLQCAGNMGR